VTAIPVRWLTVFLDFPADSFGAGLAFWCEVTSSTSAGTSVTALLLANSTATRAKRTRPCLRYGATVRRSSRAMRVMAVI